MKRTAPVLSRCGVGRCKIGLGRRAWRDFSTGTVSRTARHPQLAQGSQAQEVHLRGESSGQGGGGVMMQKNL